MTAERCPTCDQTGGTYKESASGPPTPVCSYECLSNAVDWRARALAAEARADQYKTDWHAAKSEFGVATSKLRSRLHAAESIARRALVEGLAECERLRGFLAAKLTQHERAIRADAAREERERVVAWLRAVDKNGRRDGSDTVAALFHDAADAIERGDHAKGGR